MRRLAILAALTVSLLEMRPAPGAPLHELHVLPQPDSVVAGGCTAPIPRVAPGALDGAAVDEIRERWSALGIPLSAVDHSEIQERIDSALGAQAYVLDVDSNGVRIAAGDADGAFYAAMTLAQLPERVDGRWRVPCLHVADRPALRWRILSDDVSRGPLPTMTYFERRIRTIAAIKMNGYSPYMEHVFVDPHDPLPAPLDGITPDQLRTLAAYAGRFHVTFIPEQQTFAHMHNTLKFETYADAAELPHGFLLTPVSTTASAYQATLIRDELAVLPHPPFFHIGSDETSSLGDGRSRALVASIGRTRAFADHVNAMNRLIAPSGARIMLWDDAIENDPAIMALLPRNAVIVNWHYGAEKTFVPYIRRIAAGGFDQLVAPGASNWNQIYPDLRLAYDNEYRFVDEGKSAHVLGLFQTVWHDDGETLFEATWAPVIFAAANAWQTRSIDSRMFERDFVPAFFGTGDPQYAADLRNLADAQSRIAKGAYEGTDYFFWADYFDPRLASRLSESDVRAVRLEAEAVERHLLQHRPPLQAAAANAMFLAARRFDVLGRKWQIAREVRSMYDEARTTAGNPGNHALRDLYWCKYWLWELRDDDEELAPLYAAAWRYEDRDSHLASNVERYHADAQTAIRRADAVNTATVEIFGKGEPLPPLDNLLGAPGR